MSQAILGPAAIEVISSNSSGVESEVSALASVRRLDLDRIQKFLDSKNYFIQLDRIETNMVFK